MQPKRRSYLKSFKAQVIQECLEPDATIARVALVALNHGLNANLLHKWICVQEQRNVDHLPAFLPLKLPALEAQPQTTPAAIRIEVPHARGTVVVSWPVESSGACAGFLRDLLR